MFWEYIKINHRKLILILISLNLIILPGFTQWSSDTVYFNKDWKQSKRENASYYRLLNIDTARILYNVKDYFLTGQLQMEGAYRSINPDVEVGDFSYWYTNGEKHIECHFDHGILDGPYQEWFENGNLKSEKIYCQGVINGLEKEWNDDGHLIKSIQYKDGVKQGNFITYYPNGQPIRKDKYVNGMLKKGKCYTHQGKDTTYFEYFVMPKFKGGLEGFKKYILDKLNYPDSAKQSSEEGKVFVRFTIDTDGNVGRVKLVKEDKEYFNQEALRVVNTSPQWIPGKRDGKVVDVSITLPIIFKLK